MREIKSKKYVCEICDAEYDMAWQALNCEDSPVPTFKYDLGLYKDNVKVIERWFIGSDAPEVRHRAVYFVQFTSGDIGNRVSENELRYYIGDSKPTVAYPEMPSR